MTIILHQWYHRISDNMLAVAVCLVNFAGTTNLWATNSTKLAAANLPVKILAQQRGQNATKVTEDEADSLSPNISACTDIGARVTRTTNL